MISPSTKEMVWTLHEVDKCPKTKIAKKLGISRQKVYDILADESWKNRHLNDIYKNNKIEQAESLLKGLQADSRTKSAIDKILNIIDSEETLKEELQKQGGLRAVMGVMKIIVDTNRSAIASTIDERRIAATERTLVLKERELNARIENPDAFSSVTILNDSDTVKRWYEENGTDKEYPQN